MGGKRDGRKEGRYGGTERKGGESGGVIRM